MRRNNQTVFFFSSPCTSISCGVFFFQSLILACLALKVFVVSGAFFSSCTTGAANTLQNDRRRLLLTTRTSQQPASSAASPSISSSSKVRLSLFQVGGVIEDQGAATTSTTSFVWLLQGTSAFASYVGLVAWNDRPRGSLAVNAGELVEIRQSSVPGAGLGLFAKTTLSPGTILGTYPGVVVPLQQHASKLNTFPLSEGYIWRFSDNQFVIDPTNNSNGQLDSMCIGGNPNQLGSRFLFENLLKGIIIQGVPTTLCRINEPPRGRDVNVVTSEDLNRRCVTFEVERTIYAGEELFIDYGLSYDRSFYGKN